MPKYIIERDYPGAGELTDDQITMVSQKSCSIIEQLTGVEWIESYITDNKLYCVYVAPDETAVRDHAERGDFPINKVSEVRRKFGPESAQYNTAETKIPGN